jgi:hypothetical protein
VRRFLLKLCFGTTSSRHIDVSNGQFIRWLDIEEIQKLGEGYKDAEYLMITENISSVVKSKNVEIQIQCSAPDAICNEYGADTCVCNEMFLDH